MSHGNEMLSPDSAGVWIGRRRAFVACSNHRQTEVVDGRVPVIGGAAALELALEQRPARRVRADAVGARRVELIRAIDHLREALRILRTGALQVFCYLHGELRIAD